MVKFHINDNQLDISLVTSGIKTLNQHLTENIQSLPRNDIHHQHNDPNSESASHIN